MKKCLIVFALFIGLLIPFSCSDEEHVIPLRAPVNGITESTEVQNFIWQGLNIYYLWQESVPNLDDTKIKNNSSYLSFLEATPDPDVFFENLIYNRETVDKWSWIVDDYIELENYFAGVSKNNGVDFGLVGFKDKEDVYGYVRYILPNTDASEKNIKRGNLFTHVNGTKLTLGNYRNLLFNKDSDTYTLDLLEYGSGYPFTPTGISITLTKFEYTENPVFITKTFMENGHKIGYILYNSFTPNFDNELNNAFLQLKNESVTDLILDFRYNPGGRVSTALSLASMVTGQFKGELFTKEQWNSKLQTEIENSHPEWLINNFSDKMNNGNTIHSLNLNKVHIIVTGSSASASELVINGLNPYINVRLIGGKTVGKYVASVTLYDSNDFSREGANTNHRYAMQPIVLEEVNKIEENDKDGFDPHILLPEDLNNLGVLGEKEEPLLKAAINDIIGVSPKTSQTKGMKYEPITNSKLHGPLKDNMYVEKEGIKQILQRKIINPK